MEEAEFASNAEESKTSTNTKSKRRPQIFLSEPNRIEFWNTTAEEWKALLKACSTNKYLKNKDITILRLYSTFM